MTIEEESNNTVEVSTEKLVKLERLADHSYMKLTKTPDWEGPTERISYISVELCGIIRENNTVEVRREKLEELQRLADYSHKKLSKTFDWEGPTQRVGHISQELSKIIEGGDSEYKEFEMTY